MSLWSAYSYLLLKAKPHLAFAQYNAFVISDYVFLVLINVTIGLSLLEEN